MQVVARMADLEAVRRAVVEANHRAEQAIRRPVAGANHIGPIRMELRASLVRAGSHQLVAPAAEQYWQSCCSWWSQL